MTPERTSGPINLRHFSVAAGSQSARLHASHRAWRMQRREFITSLGVAAAVRAKRPTALVREAGYLLLGLVSLATVTGLYFLLDVPLVAAAFTYLVVLVLLSLVSNLSSLIVLSFIGVCCLSYFFALPIYSFRVDHPQDLITISAFVITSFVVNFLVTRVRVEQRDHLRTWQALRDANQRLEVTNDALRIENGERKCAEQALWESEYKLRQIIDTIPSHVVRYQPDGAADFMNQTFSEFVGPGVGFDNLSSVVHPEDYPKRSRDWDTHVAAAEPYDIEMRLRRADGVYRWHRSRRVPLRDANGAIVNWYGAGHDIDDQKRAEEAYREALLELAHANRVATMGQLTSSIAHEVNQPITAAVTYALAARRFLSAEPPNFHEVDDALSLIVKEGTRAGEVVGRIRALIKKAPARKDAVSINDAILEVVALTRTVAANNGVSVR